jgi:hypothetical protein
MSTAAKSSCRLALLRFGIVMLGVFAGLFWRFAAWRAPLVTELGNMEATGL